MSRQLAPRLMLLALSGAATACSPAPRGTDAGVDPTTFAVGGTVAGLLGSGLVLTLNQDEELTLTADGPFVFLTEVPSGEAYSVSLKTHPSGPSQMCTVAGSTGTVGSGDVTSIAVNCMTDAFNVGGTVTGVSGSGLVIQNNGGDDLQLTGNGQFAFPVPVASGSDYAVTVAAQPAMPTQTCAVSSGSGTIAQANVTTVQVACTTNQYTVGGTAVGLTGSGLILRNNGADDLAVVSPGSFTFATPLNSGEDYSVTVFQQPSSPAQICTASMATGTVTNNNVSGVTVTCAIPPPDAGVDSGTPDGGTVDGGSLDGGTVDGGSADAGGPVFRRVFVHSTRRFGNFGGALAADTICQNAANGENLGGTWKAWVSDATTSPAARFVQSTVPYRRLDGMQIAADWADLTDGTIDAPINLAQDGTPCCPFAIYGVWTNTRTDGTQGPGSNCSNWTSTSQQGDPGHTQMTSAQWTDSTGTSNCSTGLRLYCFEQ